MSENWNAVYQDRPYVEKNPYEGVIDFLKLIKEKGKREVLDLGCGDGRHLVHLMREGFSASGMDYSLWGTLRTREWLNREGRQAELVCAEAAFLPWPAERFDAVFSIQVIHHQRIEGIRQSFSEVKRVLRPGGYFYATMPSYPPLNWKTGVYEEIEEHTFVPLEGFEKDVPHYFFEQGELSEELAGFEVLEIKKESLSHLSALVRKAV